MMLLKKENHQVKQGPQKERQKVKKNVKNRMSKS